MKVKDITIRGPMALFICLTVITILCIGFVSVKVDQVRKFKQEAYDIMMKQYWPNPAHRIVFNQRVKELDLDWKLSLAVREEESHGDQYAYSSAKARGYYQLMYATAKDLCETYSIDFRGKMSIYDGANNIFMGLAHLNHCVDTYGDQLGIEMYNVGYGKYFKRGIRNRKYVEDVMSRLKKIEAEYDDVLTAVKDKHKVENKI